MRRCFSKRGHGGLVIGSEMSGSVSNVFMEDCQFEGTDRATRPAAEVERLLAKVRVYLIALQDGSGQWLLDMFPNLFVIVARNSWQGMFGSANLAWVNANIRKDHGPLGAVYPEAAMGVAPGVKEGDTPSFLHLVSAVRGLNDPEQPDQPSWGGQFAGITPARNHWTDHPSGGQAVRIWSRAFDNDFAARMTAMIRNLGKMTSLGLIQPFSDAAKLVVNKLGDEKALKRARIHPLTVLIAQKVYAQGHGEKGDLKWKPLSKIIDALDAAFYGAFSNVEPCGKPVLLALDVSGSMEASMIAGSCLTAREASAAMALVTAATEPDCEIIAFSALAGGGYGGMHSGGESGITRVALSPRMRLDDVIKRISAIPMGGTDCALPMIWARRQKLNVAGFITYTDSETWAGNIHPSQALRLYRDEFVSDAKAVVVGMTSNGFTLADPNDRGMMDVVGFDATTPAVIADFIRH
jgi:hypothetical protein